MREDPGGARRVGRIVEVEAYGGPRDRASHARAGRTARTSLMFGPAGRAYVYLVYGMHHCLNVVSGPEGAASAVLVRAVEVLEGRDAMVAARSASLARRGPPPRPGNPRRVASGPGLVCAAFSVDRSWNGVDLCDGGGVLRIEPAAPGDRPPLPGWGPRIGVAYAREPWSGLRWRLVDLSSPAISAPPPPEPAAEPDALPAPDAAAGR